MKASNSQDKRGKAVQVNPNMSEIKSRTKVRWIFQKFDFAQERKVVEYCYTNRDNAFLASFLNQKREHDQKKRMRKQLLKQMQSPETIQKLCPKQPLAVENFQKQMRSEQYSIQELIEINNTKLIYVDMDEFLERERKRILKNLKQQNKMQYYQIDVEQQHIDGLAPYYGHRGDLKQQKKKIAQTIKTFPPLRKPFEVKNEVKCSGLAELFCVASKAQLFEKVYVKPSVQDPFFFEAFKVLVAEVEESFNSYHKSIRQVRQIILKQVINDYVLDYFGGNPMFKIKLARPVLRKMAKQDVIRLQKLDLQILPPDILEEQYLKRLFENEPFVRYFKKHTKTPKLQIVLNEVINNKKSVIQAKINAISENKKTSTDKKMMRLHLSLRNRIDRYFILADLNRYVNEGFKMLQIYTPK